MLINAQKNLLLNFTKVQGFEVSLVLIKAQILGPRAFLIFFKNHQKQPLLLHGMGICQKGYMSKEVYLANKTWQEITFTSQIKAL